MGQNNEIKREIDLARREKIVFERVSARMVDELAETASELRQLNYEIENLYADRDAAQLRMQDLKKMYDQDKHQFLKDYEDMTLHRSDRYCHSETATVEAAPTDQRGAHVFHRR